MAGELKRHWSEVFRRTSINSLLVKEWLKKDASSPLKGLPPLPSKEDACWDVLPKHVAKAIKYSGASAPGPDGIPYLAWRKFGPLAQGTLYRALEAMQHGDAILEVEQAWARSYEDGSRFNDALLVLLPKKIWLSRRKGFPRPRRHPPPIHCQH